MPDAMSHDPTTRPHSHKSFAARDACEECMTVIRAARARQDAMSTAPEVDAIAEAMKATGRTGSDTYHRAEATVLVRALHAAGYRVVAEGDAAVSAVRRLRAEIEAIPWYGRMGVTEFRNAVITRLILAAYLAAPTEEERQHETAR